MPITNVFFVMLLFQRAAFVAAEVGASDGVLLQHLPRGGNAV
eukprot:CAMPEP_0176311492 /NCGR_PEP_ID=MMETSP0121_2-20121125/66170_1 /TAXON_ID=160619 /ORGANISM="Kryptoperidinium foliaceum, Strain CCMP 1326" /LENGTH=41 /DNA_ID= /DNA_START= /DNA_END= /DNA_ORIENTATION=